MSRHPKKKKIKRFIEYNRFVVWYATPGPERTPKTQGELAKELKVGEDTLSEWKLVDTFWGDVEKHIKLWMRSKTSNVVGALYNGVLKDKKAPEVKLWLQYAHNFAEKSGLDDETRTTLASILNDIENAKSGRKVAPKRLETKPSL